MGIFLHQTKLLLFHPIAEQKERQQKIRLEETPQQKKSRLSTNAEKRVLQRAAGPGAAVYEHAGDKLGQDWITWLEKDVSRFPQLEAALLADKNRKNESRATEPTEKKNARKMKDAKYQEKKRAAETKQERRERLNDKIIYQQNKRLPPEVIARWEESRKRTEWLKNCGGAYSQICNSLQKHTENGDWVWIHDENTKEEIMATQFQSLSQKYATIFKSLGLGSGDVVHIVTDWHYHTFMALHTACKGC